MYKTKGFIIGAILLVLVVIPGNIGLACGAEPALPPPITEPATSPSTTPKLSEETLPPTPPETNISAGYRTYTDEFNIFSISYPSDWDMAQSLNPELNQKRKAALNNLKSGIPVENNSLLFLAVPRELKGHDAATVRLTVDPVAAGVSTNDQMVDLIIRLDRQVYPDYHEFSRVKTTVNGREATIVDFDWRLAEYPRFRLLEMMMLVDKTTWFITCSTSSDDFAMWQNDFDTIVRSLRISN
ncbi:MAG: hypothetical protein MUP81_06015 [Dehalococcoidia bacterium]|nr:hypothetical protein [Dehalococcoidia bacterium]